MYQNRNSPDAKGAIDKLPSPQEYYMQHFTAAVQIAETPATSMGIAQIMDKAANDAFATSCSQRALFASHLSAGLQQLAEGPDTFDQDDARVTGLLNALSSNHEFLKDPRTLLKFIQHHKQLEISLWVSTSLVDMTRQRYYHI